MPLTLDPIELLRELGSDIPVPADTEVDAAIERLRRTRSRRRRSRRFVVLGGAGAAAAAIAAAVVAAAPWNASPQGPSLTYRPGWILHETTVTRAVPYPGARRYGRFVEEYWATPSRFRSLGYNGARWLGKRVEIAAAQGRSGSEWLSFDPVSDALYRRRSDSSVARTVDVQSYNRSKLLDGSWKVAGTQTISGRTVVKVENALPGVTYFIDAETFGLVRLVGLGAPFDGPVVRPPCNYSGHLTKTVTDFTIEYLPPTATNQRLINMAAQHPAAATKPESAMPFRFRQIRYPPQCSLRSAQP